MAPKKNIRRYSLRTQAKAEIAITRSLQPRRPTVTPFYRPLGPGEAKVTLTSVDQVGGCCLIRFSLVGIQTGSDSMTATLADMHCQRVPIRCNCGQNILDVGDEVVVRRMSTTVLEFVQLTAENKRIDATQTGGLVVIAACPGEA